MAQSNLQPYPLRTYPLSLRQMTEEELAVVFAMTSRRPEPFDEIAQIVTAEKAEKFHERWVLGYGHASVAEHAVLHMAVENLSRLSADTLEDNRLSSYTEKSSRYQLFSRDYYHVPSELDTRVELRNMFKETCDHLFATYEKLISGVSAFLKGERTRRENETDKTYGFRLRREAIDSCRFILPAATLTNIGMTINARSLEHAISKLLSSSTNEEKDLGNALKEKGMEITPTLIKYAEYNDYMAAAFTQGKNFPHEETVETKLPIDAKLINYDVDAERKVVAALLYRHSNLGYERALFNSTNMSDDDRRKLLMDNLSSLGPHDSPGRELEMVDYTFEMTMDYGAFREFKRHRMQSYIPQPFSPNLGIFTPPLITGSNLESTFRSAIAKAEEGYYQLATELSHVAPYLLTHAHRRRLITKINLRECYHLFKLRTQKQAHFSLRQVMDKALRLVVGVHPELFRHLSLRDIPDWWPYRTDSES